MNSTMRRFFAYFLGLAALVSLCLSFAQHTDAPVYFKKVGYPLMESPHFNPIVINGDFVYVTNTPSSTVDVIDKNSKKIIERIQVGIDPVSLAVRPDGKELWVSNHVSDSVSVIDTDPKSATFHVVIATIQDFDRNKATTFDEPVGIAFANNKKAYVALSRENQIAVIDVESRNIIDRLKIKSQDPRAIAVKGDKLYVIPFESGNQTQLSGGKKEEIDGNKVTFDAFYHFLKIDCHNCPSVVMDVVKRSDIPDKDLFVFNTKNNNLISTVSTLGTLLYGIAIDSKDTVYIANTDARNDVNGKAGTKNHTLSQLENRPYLNQITSIDNLGNKKIIDLEPLPPKQPLPNETVATPYALQISDDDKFLVGTAAASNKLFIIDLSDGRLTSQVSVGAGPRGIALEKNNTHKAWVYNAFDNSVSITDISNKTKIDVISNIQLDDPTDIEIKNGRKIFNAANTSTTQTFSCASCHPDGHTDQLLWILDTPKIVGGKQIPPRLTNPVRGLRDTEPYHWDGLMGDPFGGITSESRFNRTKPTCSLKDDLSCLKHLINNNLATLMSLQTKDKEKKDQLTETEKNELAKYLLSVPYPAAPKRPYTNIITANAMKGFPLFHVEGDINPNMKEPNICGNCHRMPFLTSTKTSEPILWGMDVPTWRGAYDRHQNQAQGRNKLIDYPWIKHIYNEGSTEKLFWQLSWSGENGVRTRFNPVWDMVLEMSTGFSGSFARQVTIPDKNIKLLNDPIISNKENLEFISADYVANDLKSAMENSTISKIPSLQNYSIDLISELEKAHINGSIVLEVEGVFIQQTNNVKKINLQFNPISNDGLYVDKAEPSARYSRDDLIKLATSGKFIGTFTAHHGVNSDLYKHPQPAIWSLGPIQEQRGKQSFPTISSSQKSMLISARHIKADNNIFVDGLKTSGKVNQLDGEKINVALDNLPPTGIHLLQLQESEGRFSNEFIFYVK